MIKNYNQYVKKGQNIEEVNDLHWGYENDIITKMEALSILCVFFTMTTH
jgi:hypothetical protein